MKRITKIEAAAANNSKKLRVAAYARVSTDNAEQLVSLETQKMHYEHFIKNHAEWEFAGLYYDEGLTGTKMAGRDGLLQMLSDCEKGLIDYILVKSISRFSRNTVESIETVRKLCSIGVHIYFERENIDTGKMEGELLLAILSSLAESESRSLSDNVVWGVQKRFQDGSYIIASPPYGYDNIDGKLVINEEEAAVVRRIFADTLDGHSTTSIANDLTKEGIPPRKSNRWHPSVVRAILGNEKYIGDCIFQKTYKDNLFGTRRNNCGERAQYYMKDHHEPIISREDFEAANRIVGRNRAEKGIETRTRKYQYRYAFTGRIKCGKCGHPWKRLMNNKIPCYGCTGHIEDKTLCDILPIKEDALKVAFVTMINKLGFAREKVLVSLMNGISEMDGSKDRANRIKAIDAELETISDRKQQLLSFFAGALLDPAVYEEESSTLTVREKELDDEKRAAIAAESGGYDRRIALNALIAAVPKEGYLTDFDDQMFTEHVDHIEVYSRTEIGFVMKCGPIFRERITL